MKEIKFDAARLQAVYESIAETKGVANMIVKQCAGIMAEIEAVVKNQPKSDEVKVEE